MRLRQLATLLIGISSLLFIACGQAPSNKTAIKDRAQFETFIKEL